MSLHRWIRAALASRPRTATRSSRGRLHVEALQERITPATYTVENLADAGAGSLRQAILDSNSNAGADTITFSGAGASGTIILTSGQITITGDLTITGPGAASLTVSGNNASRIFDMTDSTNGLRTVQMTGLTLSNGSIGAIQTAENLSLTSMTFLGNQGGAIAGVNVGGTPANITVMDCVFTNNTSASLLGGAIYSGAGGVLTVSSSTFTGNSASVRGGAIAAAAAGSVFISDSTFSNNTHTGASEGGGAIAITGTGTTLNVRSSTFTGNSGRSGGAVHVNSNTTAVISNSTITGNTAVNGGGGILNFGTTTLVNVTIASNTANGASGGGGVDNLGTLRATNTIISNNTATGGPGANLDGSISSGSNNLVNNASVNLQALASNGGPTQTRSLGAGSSALDAGAAALTTLSVGITNSDTTLGVAASQFLLVGQLYRIGSEIVKVQTVINSSNINVLRGQEGTTAVAHSSGAGINLAYDQRGVGYPRANGTVDVGAFEVQPPAGSLVPSLSSGDLLITDSAGVANAMSFVVSGTDLVVTDAVEQFASTGGIAGASLSNGNKTLTVPLTSITGSNITFAAGGGSDTLTVNLSGGAFGKSINFNGGAGTSDTLIIAGGTNQGTTTYNYTNANDGSVVMSNFGTVNYTGLEPITNSGTADDIIFNLPATANAATLGDDGTASNGLSRLSGATFETTDFANPTGSLTINRGNAADTLTIASIPDFNASLTVGSMGSEWSSVTFSGNATLGADRNLSVHASGAIAVSSEVETVGAGTITLMTARNISLTSGSKLTTASGTITLTANQQMTASAGDFMGIDVNGATIRSTSGAIALSGRGGDAPGGGLGGLQHGVRVRNNGVVGIGTSGPVSVTGTGGPSSGNSNYGVEAVSVGQITSGGGNVTVIGTGGGTGSSSVNTGVRLIDSGEITAGGNGTVTIQGNGGATAGVANYGVLVSDGGTRITSSNGAVSVTGTGGGSGTAGQNFGVIVVGSTITAGGSGAVSVVGYGGNTTGTDGTQNHGVYVFLSGSAITSNGGPVSVTGTGGGSGSGGSNYGVYLESSGRIHADANGSVNVQATGGGGSGGSNYGLFVTGTNSRITSSGGAVSVTGIAASLSTSEEIRLESSGQITSGNNAAISVTADSINIVATSNGVNSGSGVTTIQPRTAGTLINLGGADVLTGSPLTLGLTSAEVNLITAGTLIIGRDDIAAGTVTVSSAIAPTNAPALQVITARNISVGANLTGGSGGLTLRANQQTTATAGNFVGINVSSGVTVTTTGGGNVLLQGRGGDSGGFNTGVRVLAAVVSGSGTVTVEGTGGASSGSSNEGVNVFFTNSQITSSGGAVLVKGTGGGTGNSIFNFGVHIETGGAITNAGTGPGATVTVEGQGGNSSGTGNNNHGVRVHESNSRITSSGGAVLVKGTGGGSGFSTSNYGIEVSESGVITSAGTGAGATVTVEGQGGNLAGLGSGNSGISVFDSGQITSSGGAVLAKGTGGGTGISQNNFGVSVSSGGLITSAGAGPGATVTVEGKGGAAGAGNNGVLVVDTNSRIGSSGGAVSVTGSGSGSGSGSEAIRLEASGRIASGGNGAVTIVADSFGIIVGSLGINSGSGATTIRPRTAGTLVNLGSADVLTGSPLTLGLSEAELDLVSAASITIGNASSGTITLSDNVTRPASTNVNLVSGGAIDFNLASLNTNGGALSLAPGTGGVKPRQSVTDVTASTVSFVAGSDLTLNIASATVDSGYDQLKVAGAVNLSGVDLNLTGSYVPVPGNILTVVSATNIASTFNGLGEGDILAFNGVNLRVNYTATTVTLTVAPPTVTGIAPVIGPTTGGTLISIVGSNFISISAVNVGGSPLVLSSYTVLSTTQITATMPAHAAGTVDVEVVNAAGAGSLAGSSDFTYAAPAVASVVVNSSLKTVTLTGTGSVVSLAGQNSVVKHIVVTFNQAVTVASDAFTITPRASSLVTVSGGAAPSTAAVTTSVSALNASQYLVTFSGAGTHDNGILHSGVYDLTTLASKVTANGETMAGNQTKTFFAMFGTIDANNTYSSPIGNGGSNAFVDPGSLFQFSDAFGSNAATPAGPPAYSVDFDFNLDGFIDPGDLFAFSDSFGIDWDF